MNLKNFRNLENREFEIVQVALNQISLKLSLYLEARRSLLYFAPKYNYKSPIYLITNSLKNNLKHFESNLKINSAGTHLGFMENSNFFLSLEGAEFFLSENLIPDQRLVSVSKEGEKSILYGNPIEKKMILNIDTSLKRDSIVLILNQSSELISLGHLEADLRNFDAMNERAIVAKNLIDKGYYLRKKQ